jgi:cytidylate kinase
MDILQAKHEKMARESFEKDEDIDRRLARMIELTGEIVVADRQSRRH